MSSVTKEIYLPKEAQNKYTSRRKHNNTGFIYMYNYLHIYKIVIIWATDESAEQPLQVPNGSPSGSAQATSFIQNSLKVLCTFQWESDYLFQEKSWLEGLRSIECPHIRGLVESPTDNIYSRKTPDWKDVEAVNALTSWAVTWYKVRASWSKVHIIWEQSAWSMKR